MAISDYHLEPSLFYKLLRIKKQKQNILKYETRIILGGGTNAKKHY